LLGSLLLYALAGTTGAYFNNLYLILLGRALLGITVAGNMIAITTLIGDYFKGDERNRFMGYQGSFMAFGGVFFIILAGWLADISWELPFWIYSFSLAVMVMCYFFVPEPKKELVAPITPAIKPEFKNHALMWFVMLMGFSGMALFYIIPAQIPFLLTAIEGVSNSMIGYAISVSTLFGAFISFFYGWFRKFLSFQWIYAVAFLLFAIGFIVISFADGYFQVVAGLAVAGSGTGLLFPNANLWMIQLAPDSKRGQMIGNLNMAVFLGQFISPLLVHPFIEKAGVHAAFLYPGLFMLAIAFAFGLQQWLLRARPQHGSML
jgi:MFS family permease